MQHETFIFSEIMLHILERLIIEVLNLHTVAAIHNHVSTYLDVIPPTSPPPPYEIMDEGYESGGGGRHRRHSSTLSSSSVESLPLNEDDT